MMRNYDMVVMTKSPSADEYGVLVFKMRMFLCDAQLQQNMIKKIWRLTPYMRVSLAENTPTF